jgi:hypothetical protein
MNLAAILIGDRFVFSSPVSKKSDLICVHPNPGFHVPVSTNPSQFILPQLLSLVRVDRALDEEMLLVFGFLHFPLTFSVGDLVDVRCPVFACRIVFEIQPKGVVDVSGNMIFPWPQAPVFERAAIIGPWPLVELFPSEQTLLRRG